MMLDPVYKTCCDYDTATSHRAGEIGNGLYTGQSFVAALLSALIIIIML